ncbi:MAG TPA: two-component regulator propeller domain-containing protein [Opitutus sp.]|nr:two-component regulator propeller domain-containing protein [Opitutus sp.]
MATAALVCGGAVVCAAPTAATVAPMGNFVRISEDEGLAHSDVRAMAQDRDGFLWFGLRLGGLTRFDGYELKSHQHDPANPRSIGNQIIWSLLVDRNGTLWIGTEGGLDRYDRSTDSFVHHRRDPARPESLPNNVVTCLYEDSRGTLWVGTRDGLARLDDREAGRFTTFRRPQLIEGSTTKDTFRSITEDPSTGLLWLGANDGLAAFDPRTGAFASYLHDPADPESLSRNAVNKVLRDEHGTFWALTEFGANSFRPAFAQVAQHSVGTPRIRFTRQIPPGGPANPGTVFIRDGLIDRRGRLWFASRGGVQLFDRATGTFTTYRRDAADPTSLSDDLVQSIFEDRGGNLWVGTYAGGVNRLRSETKPFRVHRHQLSNPHSLSEDRVSGLAFDASGRLWAATVNGLNRLDGDKWTRFLHRPDDPESLPTNDLSTMAAGPDGSLWIGSNYGGLSRFDGRRFQRFPTSPTNAPAANGWHPFTGVQVNSILPEADGGVWIGARSYGLDYLKDGRFRHYNPQESQGARPAQPTMNPLFGFAAENGDLWFATETSGLVRFERAAQRFTAFQDLGGPPGLARTLHCMADGGGGIVWLGAADGLLKFDTKAGRLVRQYTVADGLPNPAVVTIVRDRRGHLWVATAKGLADFDPQAETFRVYEKPDGLPANVFSQRTGALGPDGRVYLGTRAGIVDFAPEALKDNPVPPAVVITELRWLGRPPPDAHGQRRETVLNIADPIRVPAGQLGFSLRFSALDFAAPEKNRFRYRLEGWDAEWSSASARERIATYTSLPPGTYRFQVQASNSDQVWNEIGASVQVVVEPHLWQTLWFRLGLAGAGVVVLAAGLQWRLRVVRQRNASLEQQVSLRTAQLQEEIGVRQRAEKALRESHAELERRVQERTAELAETNLSLQAEITERKSVEAQLRHSQKMETIGQLAGGIEHDFNNLLTVILGQSELLSDSGLSPGDRDAAVRDIKAAAQRATNLTRQLLVFSRHQEVNTVAVDLNAVVAGMSKLLRHVIGERVALETGLHAGALGTLADPGMLEQVLVNMAVNARDAMPRGGRLRIATAKVAVGAEQAARTPHATSGEFARLSVSDTGTGIPPEILPQIFEPFFTTKESGKGTGLGLAISQGIIHQHRGWIEVETRVGEGTTFHVFLPIRACTPESAGRQAELRLHAAGDRTVLVAEDETAVRSLVHNVLTRHGYRVIEASSAADAITRWTEHRQEISVLLTDIVMPGPLDGHDLARRLSAEEPKLRVITMSGYDPSEVEGGSGERNVHLRKPFTADELVTAIERALRR